MLIVTNTYIYMQKYKYGFTVLYTTICVYTGVTTFKTNCDFSCKFFKEYFTGTVWSETMWLIPNFIYATICNAQHV